MSKDEALHKGHRQRLLKKYLENGISSLEEHEILEILLFFAFSRCNTNDLSHMLINRFGGIREILSSPVDEIASIKGIGENSAVILRFLGDFVDTYGIKSESYIMLDNVEKVIDFCKECFRDSEKEFLNALMLDKRMCLVASMSFTDCEFSMINIDLRSILMKAFNVNASSLVFIHNHPHSSALASTSDIKCTRAIANALSALNIKINDHIIIGEDGYVSMRKMKYLEDIW